MIQAKYERDLDILVVEERSYEDFEESLELGGFVLDLDSNKNFLGLEIIDASQKTGFSKDQLEKVEELDLDDLEISLQKDDEVIRIQVTLNLDSQRSVISSQYPASTVA